MIFWLVPRFDAKLIVPVAEEHSLRRLAMLLPQCHGQSQSLREKQKTKDEERRKGGVSEIERHRHG